MSRQLIGVYAYAGLALYLTKCYGHITEKLVTLKQHQGMLTDRSKDGFMLEYSALTSRQILSARFTRGSCSMFDSQSLVLIGASSATAVGTLPAGGGTVTVCSPMPSPAPSVVPVKPCTSYLEVHTGGESAEDDNLLKQPLPPASLTPQLLHTPRPTRWSMLGL